jgi:hypothetical protein
VGRSPQGKIEYSRKNTIPGDYLDTSGLAQETKFLPVNKRGGFRKKKPFHSGALGFQLALLPLIVGHNNINRQNVEPNHSLTYVDSQLARWRALEAKDFKPVNSVPST